MRSSLPLARMRLSILLCIPLCMTLSACGSRINLSMIAPPCAPLVKASGLLEPTPGAARPATPAVGELAAFGDRQTGQLDKANGDKAGAGAILTLCEQRNADAIEAAKPKGFLRRIFG